MTANVLDVSGYGVFLSLQQCHEAIRRYERLGECFDNLDFPIIDGLSSCADLHNTMVEARAKRDTVAYKKSFGVAAWSMVSYFNPNEAVTVTFEQYGTKNATDEQIKKLDDMFSAIWMKTELRNWKGDDVKNNCHYQDAAIYAGHVFLAEFRRIMNI